MHQVLKILVIVVIQVKIVPAKAGGLILLILRFRRIKILINFQMEVDKKVVDAVNGCGEAVEASEGVKDVIRVTSGSDGISKDKGSEDEYYTVKIRKDLLDSGVQNVVNASQMVLTNIVPDLGVGAAICSAVGTAIKYSGGMGPVQRMALIGGSAAVTGAGAKNGIGVGKAVLKIWG
jgi:hypothetical protein